MSTPPPLNPPQPPQPPSGSSGDDRYEIIEQISETDFAFLFKARDKVLNRDVAIKQVKDEFLAEPEKLESYWREARMLAELEHPYIITIYDVVQSKGWLILELMQGSLKQKLAGEPIDLEDLRLTMVYVCQALHCLHEKGIVHGDVKPGNLLLDKNNRIRLGDFGVAAELSADSDLAIKGTPKYLPPEVISPDDFGDVGPSSDLYSLGFTAYELMCGDNFEQLFPGLHLFGGDATAQWLMWHSAADRKLPEIARVLEGVPENLARVIEKLCEKHLNKRYKTAEKVILELKHGTDDPETTATREEKAELEEQKAKEASAPRKWLVYGALVGSMLLSVAMFFFLPSGEGPPPAPPEKEPPNAGVVVDVDLEKFLIKIQPDQGEVHTDRFRPKFDAIRVNDGVKIPLKELRTGDEVRITRAKTADGVTLEYNAIRPLSQTTQGVATLVETSNAFLTLQPESGDPLRVYVPANAAITLNDVAKQEGRPYTLAALKKNDRLVVEHLEGENGRHARAINALRTLPFTGKVISINKDTRELTAASTGAAPGKNLVLPVAKSATLSLNGSKVINGNEFTFLDLKAGDIVSVKHDVVITEVAASRGLTAQGVVDAVNIKDRTIDVTVNNTGARSVTFALAETCPIQLKDSSEPIGLDFIRPDDTIWLQHLSPDLKSPTASLVEISPHSDKQTWAVIIGQTKYDDPSVTRIPNAENDITAVRDVLRERYRVDEEQLLVSLDQTKLKITKEFPEFLASVKAGSQLIVYVLAHGYVSDTGLPVMAAHTFNGAKIDETGVPLQWLVQAMEAAPTDNKTLILDIAHDVAGKYQAKQLSSAEMVDLVRMNQEETPVSTSVLLIASGSKNEKGFMLRGEERGAFSTVLAQAFSGAADTDRDLRVSGPELFAYLNSELPLLRGSRGASLHPMQFPPGEAPDPVGDDYREQVAEILAAARNTRVMNDDWKVSYEVAMRNKPALPQAKEAAALYYVQHNRSKTSLDHFEVLRTEHPDSKITRLMLAWQYFLKGTAASAPADQDWFRRGVAELEALVSIITARALEGELTEFDHYALKIAADLHQFATKGAENSLDRGTDMKNLDGMLIKLIAAAPPTRDIFTQASESVDKLKDAVEKKIAGATDETTRRRHEFDLHRLTYYTRINVDKLLAEVETSLQE